TKLRRSDSKTDESPRRFILGNPRVATEEPPGAPLILSASGETPVVQVCLLHLEHHSNNNNWETRSRGASTAGYTNTSGTVFGSCIICTNRTKVVSLLTTWVTRLITLIAP